MASEGNKQEILLESGTNELEIIGFSIGKALYGINIAKVREIIKADINIVAVPDAYSSIEGAINLRGKIIPVINLARHLNMDVSVDTKTNRIIVSEFNKITIGFLVTSVANIHRLSWKQVEKPSDMLQTQQGYTVGVIKINEKVLFLLDFETIASQINPKAGLVDPHESQYVPSETKIDRSSKTVLVADDSGFTRNMILNYLKEAGYKTVAVTDGMEAWKNITETISSTGFKKIEDHIQMLVTDIEMPQMDGLHLVKRIKANPKSKKLPCIAFSSMISPELSKKCQSVGTDGEIAKPDIDKLVDLVDSKVL